MLLVVAVLLFWSAHAQTAWRVTSTPELLDALHRYAAGDSIELEPGEYVLRAPPTGSAPIELDRAVRLASRDKLKRAIVRADSSSLLFAVTSSDVTISDLIVGRQVTGGDERSIDVFIGAGTQTEPANARLAYGVVASSSLAKRSTLPSRSEIVAARALFGSDCPDPHPKQKRNADATMRALHNVRVNNVDFTSSRSGTNVAFARGSYADVSVTRCSFGRMGVKYINALVGVADARFVNLAVQYNSFRDTEALFGAASVDPAAFGSNYWEPALPAVFIGGARRVVDTYCVDGQCAQLAPVLDLDRPTAVFATLQDAVAQGATRIRVVSNIELPRAVTITRQGTTIEGNEGCGGAPLIRFARGAALISLNGALSGVRNLQFAVLGTGAAAIVYTDGVAQTLAVAKFAEPLLAATDGVVSSDSSTATVLFDGVSFLGDDSADQVALLISAPRVRIEMEDVLVAQVQYGAVVHRGMLVASSTTFFGAEGAAVYAETTTRQAGVRVSESTIADCQAPIQLGGGASVAQLREFRVTCSQFLFNRRANPVVSQDCAKQPALCAEALRYNTIITDLPEQDEKTLVNTPVAPAVRAERRLLRQGMNHVEYARDRARFAYFGSANEFSLQDSQGRLSSVHAVLTGQRAEQRTFLLATYAPLRSECTPLDSALFGSSATIVSSVLEVRSDSLLHECATLTASFRIANSSLLPPLSNLGVYGVARLGQDARWTRERATVHPSTRDNGNDAVVETSLTVRNEDERHNHRIVVISHAPLPDAALAAAESGAANAVDQQRAIGRALCVACGGVDIPSHLLDTHCAGNSENIRDTFDQAYDELGFGRGTGAPRQEAISIFVYGQCDIRRCTVRIDQNENVEGASTLVRGTLRRAVDLKCDADAPLILFTDRSSKATLRYMSVDARDSTEKVQACAVTVEGNVAVPVAGPTVAYSSIGGALCVDTRAGGRYIGNDIVSDGVAVLFSFAQPATKKHAEQTVIFEANSVARGDVQISGYTLLTSGGAANDASVTPVSAKWEVRADRNTFSDGAERHGFAATGELLSVTLTNNKQVGRLECDETRTSRFTAVSNELAPGALVALGSRASASFAPASVAQRCDITLAGTAHLAETAFDSASTVTIAHTAAVVLRNVLFESVERTLVTHTQLPLCSYSEKSTVGIDLLRSAIFNADGARILTQQQASMVAASGSSYYFALDGALAQCAVNGARIREEERCGCAEALYTDETAEALAEQRRRAQEEAEHRAAELNAAARIAAGQELPPAPREPTPEEQLAAVLAQQEQALRDARALQTDEASSSISSDGEDGEDDDDLFDSDDDDDGEDDDNLDDDDDDDTTNDPEDPEDGDDDDDDDGIDGLDDDDADDDDDDLEGSEALFWILVLVPLVCVLVCCCVVFYTRYRTGPTTSELETMRMGERAVVKPTGKRMETHHYRGDQRQDHGFDAFRVDATPAPVPAVVAASTPVTATNTAALSSSSSGSQVRKRDRRPARGGHIDTL